MDKMLIIWLAAVVIFAILETLTTQMICIWFAVSSLVSLAAALLGAPLWLQFTLFLASTGVLLYFTRPLAKKLMKKGTTRTNADRALGMTAIVTEEINNDTSGGQARVNNQIWSARSISGAVIPVGSRVIVHSIEGVKLMVDEVFDKQINSEEAAQC